MALLIGDRYRSKLEKALIAQGFRVFWMPYNTALDPRLAAHADLSALRLDGGRSGKAIVFSGSVCRGEALDSYLINNNYVIINALASQGPNYPCDASLCACAVGKRLIHSRHVSDEAILREFCGEYIDVRQGYARCSVCAVDDSSVITADAGIAAAAERAGITVLRISPGHVALDGFSYGFIGGASFCCGSTVYFTGSLAAHPDGSRIADFISARGKASVCLTDMQLFDIGSAVVV